MGKELQTPNNWHWRITPAQIERIKAGERETVNRVYSDNLCTFRKMAGRYCRNARCYDVLEDCVNQIYVDLPKYNYANTKTLFWSIYGSFRRASMLTRTPLLSLDAPLSDDGEMTLLDTIEVNGFAEQEEQEHARNVLEIIAEQKQLTAKQRDQLTAIAFGVALYRGIYAEEFRQAYSA